MQLCLEVRTSVIGNLLVSLEAIIHIYAPFPHNRSHLKSLILCRVIMTNAFSIVWSKDSWHKLEIRQELAQVFFSLSFSERVEMVVEDDVVLFCGNVGVFWEKVAKVFMGMHSRTNFTVA